MSFISGQESRNQITSNNVSNFSFLRKKVQKKNLIYVHPGRSQGGAYSLCGGGGICTAEERDIYSSKPPRKFNGQFESTSGKVSRMLQLDLVKDQI